MPPTETAEIQKAGAQPSLLKKVAERYGLDAGKFYGMVKTTIFPSKKGKNGEADFVPTDEMIMAFLTVCDEYELNPILREIYPFVDSNGNMRVIVGVDGWIKVVQRHPRYDGHKFTPHMDTDGKLVAVTCSIFRTDRKNAIEMTEYLHECRRATDPWNQWPSRMLHHKAYIQTARYAFGLSGMIDEDEAERMTAIDIQSRPVEEPKRLSESNGGARPTPLVPEPKPAETATVPRAQIPKDEFPADRAAANDAPANEEDIKAVWAVAFPKGLSKVEVNAMVKKQFGVERVAGLNKSQIEKLIGDLRVL